MAANQESTLMRTAACPGDASTDSNTPRTELKAFQKAFQNKHNRAPTKGEITGNPAIGEGLLGLRQLHIFMEMFAQLFCTSAIRNPKQ